MTETKMRTFELGGVRKGLRLDSATWTALDWMAKQQGVKWAELVRSKLAGIPDPDNMTATIREAVMDELLTRTIFHDERAEGLAAMEQHSLLKDSGMLNDEQLEDILSKATVQGESDFGGFAIAFGQDEYGQECVWVINGLRDGLHFAFVVNDRKGGQS